MYDSKNERAWRQLFEKHPIDANIARTGRHVISSRDINEFREARLMTKFDHRFQLPQILAGKQLSILPVSRGEYILSDIETFHPLTESPQLPVTEFNIPAYIESLDFSTLTGESLAINCAYVTGIIADFTQEEHLMPTVSGRMSSQTFGFNIRRTGVHSGEYLHVDVRNAQVEIDGGYEGTGSLNLIEAKNSLASDFLVRQLYYPYRLWQSRISKPVRTIYLTYTNGIFHLREYRFGELSDYNSLELVREKKYRLRDASERVIDLETLRRAIHAEPLAAEPGNVPFPQADSFERIVNFCEILYNDSDENYTKEMLSSNYDFKEKDSFDMRQVDYYTNAAIYLGLVRKVKKESGKTVFELTPTGEDAFKTKSIVERQLKFIRAIVAHGVFRAALEAYLRTGKVPGKEETVAIMKKAGICRVNSESTFRRRSSTVASWINWILGTVDA